MTTGFPPKVRDMILERAGRQGDYVRCERSGIWKPIELIQIHHRIPRGSGGTRRPEVNQAANGIAISLEAHAWIENNRLASREEGLLISKLSGQQPCNISLKLHHGWVMLDNEGGYQPVDDSEIEYREHLRAVTW